MLAPRALWAAVGLSSSLLGGCSPTAVPMVVSPTQPSTTKSPNSHSGHAARPEAAPLSPRSHMTLRDLLAYADQRSPALDVARSRTQQGAAAISTAAPPFTENPELSASVGARHTELGNGVSYSVGLAQRVDVGGERRARRVTANAISSRLDAELLASRWAVHLRVHRLYHLGLVARERVAMATDLERFAIHLQEVTRQRKLAGELSQGPVTVAEGETARAAQDRIAAETVYASLRLQLAEAAGWPVEMPPPEPVGALLLHDQLPSMQELTLVASQQHPALLVARERVVEAQATKRAADKSAWPDPTLGVTFEQESDPGATPVRVLSGHVSVPLPLWQRGQGERDEADAMGAVARSEARAIELSLGTRIARVRGEVIASARRVRAYEGEVLPRLQRSLDWSARSFELGETDVTNVFVARERLLSAGLEHLNAYEDHYLAVAALEAEVGVELWEVDGHHDSKERER